jgi:hypothetical protein
MPGTFFCVAVEIQSQNSFHGEHSACAYRKRKVSTGGNITMKFRTFVALGLGLFVLGWPGRSSATLILSFDQSVYTITAANAHTVQVPVFLSQIAGGPQVGLGNELLTGGVVVSFNNPSGIAAILAHGDVTGGPAFDSSAVGLTLTTATLGETSLLGIGDLSHSLLLGTFKFTGLVNGATTISVASLGPGPSFATAGGNFLDPTNTATATINVVPEPSTIVMAGSALGMCGIAGIWRRRRKAALYSRIEVR